jgi:hypothetical protein
MTLGAEPYLLSFEIELLYELAPGLSLAAALLPALRQMPLNRSPPTELVVMFKYRVAKKRAREKSYKCWIQMSKITEDPVTVLVSLYQFSGQLAGSYSCEWNRG